MCAMTSHVSRRWLLGVVGLAGGTAVTTAWAGDLRYRPRSGTGWPANLVAAAQQRLQDEGFDPGPVDGKYGPRTSAAIRRFQADRGMPVDGRISEALLAELGLGSQG